MKIRKLDLIRLYAVSETPNENGLFDLVPFDFEEPDFNSEFEREDLNNELDALAGHFYGDATWVEVDETEAETCGEFLRIQIGEDRIEVPDILSKINADPDDSTIFLLVARTLEDGSWVVAERFAS